MKSKYCVYNYHTTISKQSSAASTQGESGGCGVGIMKGNGRDRTVV